MKKLLLSLLPFAASLPLYAQVFSPGESGGGAPANNGGDNTTIINNNGGNQQKSKSLLGNDVPFVDPGSETAQWDGKHWNVTNNRLFRARFEKYLAAPEDSAAKDKAYRELLQGAMKNLAPTHPGGPDIAAAMRKLAEAANHPIDANLCGSIAQAVYSVVLHRKNEARLTKLNRDLEVMRQNKAWNYEVAAAAAATREKMENQSAGGGGGANGAQATQPKPKTAAETTGEYTRAGGYIKQIVEIEAARVANAAKMTASELKSKVEFQALIVQLFLQRRFEHVILGCRIYRNLYEDGDSELKLKEGSDVEKMFTRTTGTTPTVSALDALSNEFIREVDEGVIAFEYLADKRELESASKRLSEAFMLGEYLPRMRTLPRTKKEKLLAFVRDSNQLLSAIEVKDYGLAEEVVNRIGKDAKDFDYSKPRAAIEVARSTSRLHIQAARSAALKGDEAKLSESIKAAVEIWPTNPELRQFSDKVAAYGDSVSQELNSLDTLIAQKNYREVFRNKEKFAGYAATSGKKEYIDKLKTVVDQVAEIEMVINGSSRLEKAGDPYGAWEALKEIQKTHPDDNELNSNLTRLSESCADFITAVNDAKKHEESRRTGVGLSAWLRAEQIYPNSKLAREGIDRLANIILPENDRLGNQPPRPSDAPEEANPFLTPPPDSATPSVSTVAPR